MIRSTSERRPRAVARRTALRNPAFRSLWAAQGVSVLGTQFSSFALPVVAVLLLHADQWQLGVLSAAETVAFLVIGLPAGAWVDRWLKRRTMLAADIVRGVALASIPVLWWAGALSVWQLVAVAVVVGFATVFFDVAYQSYVPLLLPREQMQGANSTLESTAQIARIGGPAAAGLLLRVVSAPVIVVIDAVSYLVSAAFLSTIRDGEVRRPASEHRPLRTEIAEGVRFVVHHPTVRRVTLSTATSNLFSTMIFTLLPLLVLRSLHLGTTGLGFAYSAGSVGGLLGALSTPWIARRFGEGRTIGWSALLAGVALVGLPLAGLFPDAALGLVIASEFVCLFMVLVYNITQLTLRQRACPPALLGRMNASIRFVVWGIMPFGALAAGGLGTAFGTETTMWIAVAGSIVAAGFVIGPGLVPAERSTEDTAATASPVETTATASATGTGPTETNR